MFGVKAIQFRNGFDFSKSRIRKINPKISEDETINIVLCALFSRWHGYERIINGLHEYYQSGGMRNIVLHFVGEGKESDNYKNLVSRYGLGAHAIFHGSKSWGEIEGIYDMCDLAVASLGIYKMKIEYICSLKLREYLAAGLPIIGTGRMDVEECDGLRGYILSFPNDSTAIPMDRVIAFYDDLYRGKSKEEVIGMCVSIRNAIEKNFNMDAAMANIVRYIKEDG